MARRFCQRGKETHLSTQDILEAGERADSRRFEIRFPSANGAQFDQDEEWCEVRLDDGWRRIRFHDYDEVYSVPGLYEQLFYDELKCDSPRTVCGLLKRQLEVSGYDASSLRVLDVGAGNGMVGEELQRELGVGTLVGVDIIEEAEMAAERDRPGVYDAYYTIDLTALPADIRSDLCERQLNTLVTVAALGFGDIPPQAFAEAFNLITDHGWVAFNIRDRFLEEETSPFSRLIGRMLDEGVLERRAERRYRHRLSVRGEPLHYVAVVAEKHGDVSREWVDAIG
jgi:trans-aconitate methyltransferase